MTDLTGPCSRCKSGVGCIQGALEGLIRATQACRSLPQPHYLPQLQPDSLDAREGDVAHFQPKLVAPAHTGDEPPEQPAGGHPQRTASGKRDAGSVLGGLHRQLLFTHRGHENHRSTAAASSSRGRNRAIKASHTRLHIVGTPVQCHHFQGTHCHIEINCSAQSVTQERIGVPTHLSASYCSVVLSLHVGSVCRKHPLRHWWPLV